MTWQELYNFSQVTENSRSLMMPTTYQPLNATLEINYCTSGENYWHDSILMKNPHKPCEDFGPLSITKIDSDTTQSLTITQ